MTRKQVGGSSPPRQAEAPAHLPKASTTAAPTAAASPSSTATPPRVSRGDVLALVLAILAFLIVACSGGYWLLRNPAELHALRLWWVKKRLMNAEVVPASSLRVGGHAGPPPPPVMGGATPPPSLTKSQPVEAPPELHAATTKSPSAGAADQKPWVYSLADYSKEFLHPPKPNTPEKLFFACGTRLTDPSLHLPPNAVYAPGGQPAQSAATPPSSPSLVIVLTPQERVWHRRRTLHPATKLIPLDHVNDDYCDCLDGSDEVWTNACSMSGPMAPLAGVRWRPYLVATAGIQLYEDEVAAAEREAAAAKIRSDGFTVAQTRVSAVERRLRMQHVLGGPVLPYRCNADHEVLLSPSMVGDGIVDCCDGSDEAYPRSHPYLASQLSEEARASRSAAFAHYTAETHREWQERLAAFADHRLEHPLNPPDAYADKLHPHLTSTEALLVEKEYTSLFTCPVVTATRLAAALAVQQVVEKGHQVFLVRQSRGWEKLGKELLDERVRLTEDLTNTSRDIELLQRQVRAQVQANPQARTVMEAGVHPEVLQRLQYLSKRRQYVQQELQFNTITTVQHVYGDRYEYYPLRKRILPCPIADITDSTATSVTALRRERQRRQQTLSEMISPRPDGAGGGFRPSAEVHVDNVTVSLHGVSLARALLAVQQYTTQEAEVVARQLGLVEPDSPFDPAVLHNISDPFRKSPLLFFGHWQPYDTQETAAAMSLLDPAGDVDLPRRALVAPASPLYRGGGGGAHLQWRSRQPEMNQIVRASKHSGKGATEDDPKARMKEAAEEEKKQAEVETVLLHHVNTPNILATHVFKGGMRCELDPPPEDRSNEAEVKTDRHREETPPPSVHARNSYGYVAYVCDVTDRVLAWGKNGKCAHEVVVGTPSACPMWVVRAAADRVQRAQANLRE